MVNLFSMFDPSTTTIVIPTNWIAIFIVFSIKPTYFWLNQIGEMKEMKLFFSEYKPIFNKAPYVLLPFLTMFIFIAVSNIMSLFPYIYTPNAHITLTLTLAFPAWLVSFWYPFSNKTKESLAHLVPYGTPMILIPFMVLIECISIIIRPITLSIRLAANMIAGHLLLALVCTAKNSEPMFLMAGLVDSAGTALLVLEMAVSIIQAFVFTTLLVLYLSDSSVGGRKGVSLLNLL